MRRGAFLSPWLIILLLIAGWIFLVLFGAQTLAVISIKRKTTEMPELCLVPKPLPLSEQPPIAGTRISHFGYEFEVPWAPVSQKKRKLGVELSSESGKEVSFSRPQKAGGWLNNLEKTWGMKEQKLRALLGSSCLRSEYDLYSAILKTSPYDIHILMPRKQAVRTSVLLAMKAMLTCGSAIYSFERGSVKGFQFGDPATDRFVCIEAFDEENTHLEFLFSATRDRQGRLSQEEINTLILTLRRVER